MGFEIPAFRRPFPCQGMCGLNASTLQRILECAPEWTLDAQEAQARPVGPHFCLVLTWKSNLEHTQLFCATSTTGMAENILSTVIGPSDRRTSVKRLMVLKAICKLLQWNRASQFGCALPCWILSTMINLSLFVSWDKRPFFNGPGSFSPPKD